VRMRGEWKGPRVMSNEDTGISGVESSGSATVVLVTYLVT